MKRILFGISISIIFLSLVLISAYNYANKNYGISLPSIKNIIDPTEKNIAEYLPQGSDLNKPIKIPDGFRLAIFADVKDLGMPRVLAFDKNNILFTTLTGSGKVVVLPDNNKDGIVDEIKVVLTGLNKPHGIVFDNNEVYVAESDKVVKYTYDPILLQFSSGKRILDLPNAGRHFTRTLKINNNKLYVSVGSSCDTCSESDKRRASILVSNLDGSNLENFATGLRNTAFFVFDKDNRIWGNDMGRDFLGDNLPPDELNIIEEGKNYGWPECYGKSIKDDKFRSWEAFNNCNETSPSAYDYPAHSAPLGITFINSGLFDKKDRGNVLASFHGSWNSSKPVGYKIVKLTVLDGKIEKMEDFIYGFLTEDGEILGRPVDLIFDNQGLLYISDDKAGVIYILTK